MRLRGQCERAVVGCYHQISPCQLPPEKGCGQMNGIERTQFRRHRLRCPIEHHGVDLD